MISPDELRPFPLFKNIDAAALEPLAQVMRHKAYTKNVVLFRKGDPGDAMMLICEGEVRVFLNNEAGDEITLRSLGVGQILGEFALLDRKARSASASALSPLDVLVLERADFLRVLQERPLIGIELMRGLAERIRYATHYLERLYDALDLLSNNEYEQAIREMSVSADEDEIQELITTFLKMAHRLQARAVPPDGSNKNPS